jgi:hypothetical protein
MAQEQKHAGPLTLSLRELVREVLFDPVIVAGLEVEWSPVVVLIGLH